MKLLPLLAVFCATSLLPLHAQEKFDYAATVALARERCPVAINDDKAIFILGPDQNRETQFIEGKEIEKVIPFFTILSTSGKMSAGSVLSSPQLGLGEGSYQVLLYRAGQSEPTVRLQGDAKGLARSQFPIKAGDVYVITAVPKTKS